MEPILYSFEIPIVSTNAWIEDRELIENKPNVINFTYIYICIKNVPYAIILQLHRGIEMSLTVKTPPSFLSLFM